MFSVNGQGGSPTDRVATGWLHTPRWLSWRFKASVHSTALRRHCENCKFEVSSRAVCTPRGAELLQAV